LIEYLSTPRATSIDVGIQDDASDGEMVAFAVRLVELSNDVIRFNHVVALNDFSAKTVVLGHDDKDFDFRVHQ
jgi:hypothetical protein